MTHSSIPPAASSSALSALHDVLRPASNKIEQTTIKKIARPYTQVSLISQYLSLQFKRIPAQMQLVQAPSRSRSGRQPHLGAAWHSHRRAIPTPPLGQALGHIISGRCHFDRGRFSVLGAETADVTAIFCISSVLQRLERIYYTGSRCLYFLFTQQCIKYLWSTLANLRQ